MALKKANIKSTLSEYGPIAYQIKRNEAYINMLANILPLHIPLGWGQKVILFFSESSPVALQINWNDACKYSALLHTKKHFFSEGHVAYQIKMKEVWDIMQVKCLALCHTGQCKRTGGCYNELVVAFYSTGGGVKGKKIYTCRLYYLFINLHLFYL